ncbi:MAG: hypothetical protein JRC89_10005 [Deltaproteobacteria bacterium]|nr:hypothetical protein [Deltaproteobacteria bacterium]
MKPVKIALLIVSTTTVIFLLCYIYLTYEHSRFKYSIGSVVHHIRYIKNLHNMFNIQKSDNNVLGPSQLELNKRFWDEKYYLDVDANRFGNIRSLSDYFDHEFIQIGTVAHFLGAKMSYLGSDKEWKNNPSGRFSLENLTDNHISSLTALEAQAISKLEKTNCPIFFQYITILSALAAVVISVSEQFKANKSNSTDAKSRAAD